MNGDLVNAIAVAGISGIVSSVLTVVAIKVDLYWLKVSLRDHENRIRKIEHNKCEPTELDGLGV